MKVTERDGTLVVRDTPGCLWLFGAWFVAGGAIALPMPFIAVNRAEVPWWAKAVALGLGIATVSAGLFLIRMSPSTRTEIDRVAGRVRVAKRTPFGATRVEEFAVSDVGVLQVLPGNDSDGDTHYSLRLLLKDGREVPLHAQPAYGKDWVDARATRIRDYLARSLGP